MAFTSFVMFAEMRTGSNFLEASLNALPGVTCLGELFNPHFIGKKDHTECLGMDLAAREGDPHALLVRMRAEEGMVGFRYFHDHEPRILDDLLADPTCAKIILTRNPLESYVSLKIAQVTGQWRLTNAKNLKTAQASFDAEEFEQHLAELQQFQIRLMRGLQTGGQTAFYIDYEDLHDIDVLNGLAAFLGVAARLDAPDPKLKKQNPGAITAKVENPALMELGLARVDRFNLSRTPNFEPRRAASIPSFAATEGAGLLFMPMRGGPEQRIRAWMKGLGAGGLITDFVQKSLRLWLRSFPGHRSFTVLRHPLLRAHAVFHSQIVSGKATEHRNALMRAYEAELPAIGRPFFDLEQEQTAFLVFLRYLRLNLGGQTGQKVLPHWASQSAVLQGFAGFHGPDLVIREERLVDGLRWLTDELGLDASTPPPPDDCAEALARIWLPEMETAAEAAYSRDYLGLGFGPWRG